MRSYRFAPLLGSVLAAGLLAVPLASLPVSPAAAQIGIGVGISVHIAPPALPVYVQPPIPAPGYLWTPGYWAYGDAGYYWVPGTWVQPPSVGLLWTPGYWGYVGGVYRFNAGYWGPHVGFYGGINYGFGYIGVGFAGGEWRGGVFAYNSAFNNFGGVHITNVYNHTVNVTNVRNVSFNGPGGIDARPTPEEERFSHEQHVQATAAQRQHVETAAHDRSLLASENHGHPAVAATQKPGEFKGAGVVPSKEAAEAHNTPAGAHAAPAKAAAAHPGTEKPAGEHAAPAKTAHEPGAEHPAQAKAAHEPAAHEPGAHAGRAGHGPRSASPAQHAALRGPAGEPHANAHPAPHAGPHAGGGHRPRG
jgi:hypothetical protein